MGHLYEDLEETLELLERPVEETYLRYDLGHLTGLLGLLAFLDFSSE